MTWALAKVTKFFAICMSLRNSLKILKTVSVSEDDEAISKQQKRKNLDQCSGILMFWTIFGIFVVCEQYLEFLIRWFPLYYYAKAFFILFMAFPRLRFTEYVFYKILVPSVEFVHDNVGNISAMPPGDILTLLIFQVLFLCFPMINHPHESPGRVADENSVTNVLLVDSDGEGDDIDLDEMIDKEEDNNEEKIDDSFIDVSIRLDFGGDSSHDHDSDAGNRNRRCDRTTKDKRVEDDDYSPSFSFDDDVVDNTDDGFSLSLPEIPGRDRDTEDEEVVSEEDRNNARDEATATYESPSRVLRSFRKVIFLFWSVLKFYPSLLKTIYTVTSHKVVFSCKSSCCFLTLSIMIFCVLCMYSLYSVFSVLSACCIIC
jgi:hypothetical protein